MGYYDHEKNVQEYIEMAQGFDGRQFVPLLQKYLRDGSRILELGMGPGKDLDILGAYFEVTGSDNSQVFLDRYRQQHPVADLLLLDAITMDVDRQFDCIYSNKVLHHLTKKELVTSLHAQSKALNKGGILFHTLWHGDKKEEFSGLRFVYYTKASFTRVVGTEYEIVEWERYTEMDKDDSLYVVLQKR